MNELPFLTEQNNGGNYQENFPKKETLFNRKLVTKFVLKVECQSRE